MSLKPWIVNDQKTIFESPRISIYNETITLPDGRIIDDYIQVDMPEHAVMLVKNAVGKWLLQRQYKHGPRAVSLTFPAGQLNSGELPLEAAKRELREETGLECDDWSFLGSYVVNGNQRCGCAHLFHAQCLTATELPVESDNQDLEEQEIVWLSDLELLEAFRVGQFMISSHALAFTIAINPALRP